MFFPSLKTGQSFTQSTLTRKVSRPVFIHLPSVFLTSDLRGLEHADRVAVPSTSHRPLPAARLGTPPTIYLGRPRKHPRVLSAGLPHRGRCTITAFPGPPTASVRVSNHLLRTKTQRKSSRQIDHHFKIPYHRTHVLNCLKKTNPHTGPYGPTVLRNTHSWCPASVPPSAVKR